VARLSGNYEADLPILEKAIAVAFGANAAATAPRPATTKVALEQLDAVIVPFIAGATNVPFDVPHSLGRVPRYFIVLQSPTFLEPADLDRWTATNARFFIGFANARGSILLA
jgi:hypothetical protein